MFALLVVLAGSHFFVGVHHCGRSVRGVAFLELADGCGHNMLPSTHRMAMKGCCEDEVIQHEAQDLKVTSADIQVDAPTLLAEIQAPVLLASLIPASLPEAVVTPDYDPPLRVTDVTVDFRLLLI